MAAWRRWRDSPTAAPLRSPSHSRPTAALAAGSADRESGSPLTFVTVDGFAATDAAGLPDGDVLVLERRFPPVGARLRRIDAAALAPGARLEGRELARLEGSDTVDNMEGLAVRQGPGGATLIYLLSDDNYSPLQRTLLMMFEIGTGP